MVLTFQLRASILPAVLVAATTLLMPAVGQSAQRPDAARLLPDNTVLYIRFADTVETVAKFQETAIGRITQDPAMKPLVSQLYGTAVEAFQRVEGEIGASLDDLLSIPQGEMCLAMVRLLVTRTTPSRTTNTTCRGGLPPRS